MTVRRKLIEVALPLEAINVASAREKAIRSGHPSTLHLWWARRPLAACRAVLFASLVDDPSSDPERFPTAKAIGDERTRLFGIIERLVLWENTTNEAVLGEARAEIHRSTGGNPPPVLDPFCGGGSIPLEAQRLGLTAYASDLNPVAVLITKALIEIPPKFANQPPVHPDARRGVGASGAWKGAAGMAEDVRRYGAWMRDEAERRIGDLYPRVRLPKEYGGGEATVVAWLWARTVTCPNPACGARMPIVRSFLLSTKSGKEAWVDPIVDRVARAVHFEVRTRAADGAVPTGVELGTAFANDKGKKVQATFRCVVCRTGVAKGGYIDAEASAGRMGAMPLALVAKGTRHRVYVDFDDRQLAAATSAADVIARPDVAAKLPNEPARGTFASNAQGRYYGFREFKDYFTARQLVALTTFVGLVGEARERVLSDANAAGLPVDDRRLVGDGMGAIAYADAIATYLAFAVDREAMANNSLVRWNSVGEKAQHAFGRQGIPMIWDFAEPWPLGDSTGGLTAAVELVADPVERLPGGIGSAKQLDAAESVNGVLPSMVSTDPPYYNNVGYADLSDFFYVWLRRSLQGVFPSLFATVLTPKSAELVATPYRFDGDKSKAEEHFEHGLGDAFRLMRAAAHPDYPVTVYYAFKQAEETGDGDGSIASTGWETMLDGLMQAGFSIDGTWPIRTEMATRQVASGTNALASSIVLVCRPRHSTAGITTRKDLVGRLKNELPEALRALQHGNIAPVDLAQASIGPGMSIFSGYATVLEPDGSPMRVRTALGLINAALDEILTEQEGEFDPDTRWAIAWYEQFGLAESAFGTAETLSRAKNTSVEGLSQSGILVASKGKVRLLAREEYSPDWDPATDSRVPVWEAMQRLIRALLVDGETGASELLARLGGLGDVARDLAYRLYHVAERKGWTDEARAYNALVVAWPEIVRLAAGRPTGGPAQTSLNLGG